MFCRECASEIHSGSPARGSHAATASPEPPEPPEPYAASLPTDQLEQQIRSATQLYHRLEHKAMRTRAALDVVKALEREADAAVDAVDRRKRMLLPASAAA